MAEPAHGAAGPGPGDDPDRKPDPRASAWGDVRAAVMLEARAVRLAVGELAARPGDEAALEMTRTCLSVLEHLSVIAGRCQADEAVIRLTRDQAYAEGVADCKAARCRLEVIGGGRDG